MSLQMPEGLAGMPGGGGQPLPAGLGSQDQGSSQEDPLQVLQECIQALPGVIAALPDPQDVQDAVQALHILSRIQTRLMKGQNAAPQGQ